MPRLCTYTVLPRIIAPQSSVLIFSFALWRVTLYIEMVHHLITDRLEQFDSPKYVYPQKLTKYFLVRNCPRN